MGLSTTVWKPAIYAESNLDSAINLARKCAVSFYARIIAPGPGAPDQKVETSATIATKAGPNSAQEATESRRML